MPNTFVIKKDGNGRLVLVGRGPNKVVGRTRQSTVVTIPSPFFTDNFSGLSYNNSNGFTWSSPSNVTLVSFDGYDTLKFKYSASSAEQRFDLGRNVSQLWIEYDIYIPDNFEHKDRSGQSDNNKWLLLWRDNYSDVTSGSWRCGWEFNPLGGDIGSVGGYESGSDIRVYSSRANYNSQTDSNPYNDYAPTGNGTTFISQSGKVARTGQWNQFRIQVAAASNSASADGIQRMYINGVLHNEVSNGKFWNYTGSTSWGGTFQDCVINKGYFMGAANSGYPQETNFYIRNVKFWDENPVWQSGSVGSVTNISRDSVSTAGNVDVILTVTAITGSPQVFFGGLTASNVQVLNSTTIKCTVPPHPAGTVNVICGGEALRNPRAGVIGGNFEYLPTASTVFVNADFEGGTIPSSLTTDVGGGGTVSVQSSSRYSGTYAAKATYNGNGPAFLMNTTGIVVSDHTNGVYTRYYQLIPSSSVVNLQANNKQIKTYLSRTQVGTGQPGWVMTGVGSDFSDGVNNNTLVSFVDNGILPIVSGSSGATVTQWREIMYWQQWDSVNQRGNMKMWIDGKLQFNTASTAAGSTGSYFNRSGVAYAQTSGSVEVYVDNIFMGNGFPTESVSTTPFFEEYFVNGQKNNTNGVTWSAPNNSERVVVSSDYAYSGSHSLKFTYGPDVDLADSSAEQRFNLGRNLTEIWIEYYLRIPENFTHRFQSNGGTNNKFFRIWGDDYASANKMGASSQYSASFSEGNSGIGFEYNYKDWADGTLGFGPEGYQSGYTPYGNSTMKGQWTRVRMHYRMVTGTNADNGLMEMWFNDTKVLNFTNVPQKYDTAKPYWNAGYLMGWANTGYAEATSFYIDAIKFYDSDPGWI